MGVCVFVCVYVLREGVKFMGNRGETESVQGL